MSTLNAINCKKFNFIFAVDFYFITLFYCVSKSWKCRVLSFKLLNKNSVKNWKRSYLLMPSNVFEKIPTRCASNNNTNTNNQFPSKSHCALHKLYKSYIGRCSNIYPEEADSSFDGVFAFAFRSILSNLSFMYALQVSHRIPTLFQLWSNFPHRQFLR